MDCQEAQRYWNEGCDGAAVQPSVTQHFRECPACRRYAVQMTRLLAMLDSLRQETDTIRASRLTAVGPARLRRSTRVRSLWRVGSLSAAAALALTIGVSIFFETRPANRGPRAQSTQAVGTSVAEAPMGISLRGESTERFMAVAQPTSVPDVQVFRLYPTLRKASEADGDS